MSKDKKYIGVISIFISFDGSDGCGKTTQCRLLLDYLNKKGHKTILICEPGGTVASEKIREIILNNDIRCCNNTAVLLFCAARAQFVEEVVKPALLEGINVITDRCFDSTLLYQCLSRGVSNDDLKTVWNIIMYSMQNIIPDITFLIKRDIDSSLLSVSDRFESKGVDFQTRINDLIEQLLDIEFIKPERFCLVDGNRSIEDVFNQVKKYIDNIKGV